jgi:hypothetical protein
MSDLSPEDLAFLVKVGQIVETPKTTSKKDEE